MIPIYLCDDEPIWLRKIKEIIEKFSIQDDFDIAHAYSAASPYALLAHLHSHMEYPAIYILDIDLKSDMDGLQLAAEIRKLDTNGYIIFITTYSELAMKTFEYKVEALDYIIKDADNLENQVLSCFQHIKQEIHQIPANPDTIKLSSDKKILIIPIQEIICAEAIKGSHKVRVHKKNGLLETFIPLAKIHEMSRNQLFLCHRAYLINPVYIQEFKLSSRIFIMSNGTECTCSAGNITAARRIMKAL